MCFWFTIFSAANRRLPHIACSLGTDQEDDLSSEKESRDLLPHKGEDEGLRDKEETNKTSFTTFALCVSKHCRGELFTVRDMRVLFPKQNATGKLLETNTSH
ncbi:hypothetical protein BRARA_G00636 [Brassica rapa]|uniref:Uncharacterized protein n=1 Tax=Brassica campestris TaxID=3711 RepID=A0A397YID2_BRACM|nr:hypothetical protein BRARA_G00636 [Brassica rapa]